MIDRSTRVALAWARCLSLFGRRDHVSIGPAQRASTDRSCSIPPFRSPQREVSVVIRCIYLFSIHVATPPAAQDSWVASPSFPGGFTRHRRVGVFFRPPAIQDAWMANSAAFGEFTRDRRVGPSFVHPPATPRLLGWRVCRFQAGSRVTDVLELLFQSPAIQDAWMAHLTAFGEFMRYRRVGDPAAFWASCDPTLGPALVNSATTNTVGFFAVFGSLRSSAPSIAKLYPHHSLE